MKELIERVKGYGKTRKSWQENKKSVEFKEADKVNYYFFNQHLKTGKCNCIEDLFYFLKNANEDFINQKTEKMKSNFKLKGDVMLTLHGFEPVNNNNMTDEHAVRILAKHPGHKASFETMPDNVDELIAAHKKGEGKAASKLEAGELKTSETNENIENEKRAFLEAKTVPQLKEMLVGFPKAEWEKKKAKSDIVDYLILKSA